MTTENKDDKVIGSNNDIVKALIIDSDIQKHSMQIGADPAQFSGTDFIPPPLDPVTWANLPQFSTRLSKCINVYSQNTVGYGWSIDPIDEILKQGPNISESIKARIGRETEILHDLLDEPNADMAFSELMKQTSVDEESTGNGYVEVVRDASREIREMYHAPATITRVRKEGGFVQIKLQKKKYFKSFGDSRIINAETGAVADETLPFEKRASEIIHFKIYSPSSPFYGVPRYSASAAAVSGNRMAAERNIKFFKNNAVPPIIVSITGGVLSPESVQSIRDFMAAEAKGTDNAHRAMVLQSETSGMSALGGGNAKIEIKELGSNTEDASFQKYRESNDAEIREAFGIGEVFLGTMKAISKGNAIESRLITNDQEFKPAKRNKEYRLYHTIVMDKLQREISMSLEDAVAKFIPVDRTGDFTKSHSPLEQRDILQYELKKNFCKLVQIKDGQITYKQKPLVKITFLQPPVSDPLSDAQVDKIYGDLGAYTINELRAKLGREEIKANWANLPYPVLLHSQKVDFGTQTFTPEVVPGQPVDPSAAPADTPAPEPAAPSAENTPLNDVVNALVQIRQQIVKELQSKD